MDRPTMPDGLELARTTPEFTAATVPGGLLHAHQVAAGVWGRLRVHFGSVVFMFEDAPDQPIALAPGDHVDIPPQRPHHVAPDDDAIFVVEFHRLPSSHLKLGADGLPTEQTGHS
jgi:tellurite resistance-related uncharacterized protein